MPGISMSSVRTSLGADLQRLFNGEISAFKRFQREQSKQFYNHLDNIARAAARMDGCSSTGKVLTIQHIPWGSTVGQISRSTVASSPGLRIIIASSGMKLGASSWHVPKSRFGLTRVVGAHAQVGSTRTKMQGTVRTAQVVHVSIFGSNSTVRVCQYASSLGYTGSTLVVTAPGLVRPSSGACHLQVFAYGY